MRGVHLYYILSNESDFLANATHDRDHGHEENTEDLERRGLATSCKPHSWPCQSHAVTCRVDLKMTGAQAATEQSCPFFHHQLYELFRHVILSMQRGSNCAQTKSSMASSLTLDCKDLGQLPAQTSTARKTSQDAPGFVDLM